MSAGNIQIKDANKAQGATRWLLLVIIVAVLVSLPVLYFGFPGAAGHDSLTHFNWYKSFSAQLRAGEIYPRWLLDMNSGFGSPAFFYYPPLAHYVTSLIGFVLGGATSDGAAWRYLGVSAALAIVASGATCYLWLKNVVSPAAAAVAAIVYLLMPWHVAIDLYSRAAFGELWSFVWLPLVLKFVHDLNRNTARNFAGLSLSYALLILTHLPTLLLFSLVPLAYSWFTGEPEKRRTRLILTVLAMTLGIGIAAFYLSPAMLMKGFVSFEEQHAGSFYYDNSFLFSFRNDLEEGTARFNFRLSVLLATMIFGLFLCALSGKTSGEFTRLKSEWRFWWAVAIISIFMMIPLSKPIWQLIPILQSVQFPFRFNSILCIAQAALTAIASAKIISLYRQSPNNRRKIWIWCGAALSLCCVWAAFLMIFMPHKRYSGEDLVIYETDETTIRKLNLKEEVPEYFPKTVPAGSKQVLLDRLIEERNARNAPYFLRFNNDQAKVAVEEWSARRIVLNSTASEPTNLVVGQFYFPEWSAFASGVSNQERQPLTVAPSAQGLLDVMVPAGDSRLEIFLKPHWTEKIGALVSLLAIVFLGAAVLFLHRSERRINSTVARLEI